MAFLTEATDEQLACAIEVNAIDCCLSWAAWDCMERQDEEHLAWTVTEVPFPFFNNIFRARIPEEKVERTIQRMVAMAQERQVPLNWWTGPTTMPLDLGERLMQHGFSHCFKAPAMAMELSHLEGAPLPEGLVIREVDDEHSLQDWCSVMAPVYEFPDFAAQPLFDMLLASGLGAEKDLRHFVGSRDGHPVSTASLYLDGCVAGLSSVATHPHVRRKGIGQAITVEPLTIARELGYHYGALFSSPLGFGIYKKLGFREYGKGNCYVLVPE